MTNNQQPTTNNGFTLIEIMTSVSIFAIIMTISMGSILGIFDANRKSRTLKAAMNNINLAIESVSKEMRFGKNYHCGGGMETTPQNCPAGDNLVSFLSSEGEQVAYRLSGTTLEKKVDNGNYLPVTAPEVVIDSLVFYIVGAGTGNLLQPKVVVKVQGHSGSGDERTNFTLQTLISQRVLDL